MSGARRAVGWALIAVALLLTVAPAVATWTDLVADPGGAAEALSSGVLWERLARSVGLAAASLAIDLVVGLPLAWVLVRTDLPGRRVLLLASAAPLFVPPLIHVLTWFPATGLGGAPGLVVVQAVAYLPLVVFFAARALGQSDRSRTEAMRLVAGSRGVLTDDLRQALPAALAGCSLALVLQLSDFTVADFLSSVGPKVTVYADSVYAAYGRGDVAAAAAASLPGLAIALLALWPVVRMRRLLGVVETDSLRPAAPIPLGRLTLPVGLVVGAVVGLVALLPLVVLVWTTASVETFLRVAEDHLGAAWTSLWLSAATTALVVALSVGVAAGGSRRSVRLRGAPLEGALIASLAVPALLTGVGLIRIWNRPIFDPIYLGPGLVLIALAGRTLPLVHLPIRGAVERLPRGPLEAALLAGAGPWDRFRRVLLPQLRLPLLFAAVVCVALTLREVDTLLMLRAAHDTLPTALYRHVVFAPETDLAALALLQITVLAVPLAVATALAAWAAWPGHRPPGDPQEIK